jgi:hypothetical protein
VVIDRGAPEHWAEQLAEFALTEGISTFILASDDPGTIRAYAAEVMPTVRELVVAARSGHAAASVAPSVASPAALSVAPSVASSADPEAATDSDGSGVLGAGVLGAGGPQGPVIPRRCWPRSTCTRTS